MYECLFNNMTITQIKNKTNKQDYGYISQYFKENNLEDLTNKQVYIYTLIYTYIKKFNNKFNYIIGKKFVYYGELIKWFHDNKSIFIVSAYNEMINKDIYNNDTIKSLLELMNSNELEL